MDTAGQERVEAFRGRYPTGLVTLVFTDMVGSMALKQALGDTVAAALIEQHHTLVRQTLRQQTAAEEISTAGDSFFLLFARPSDAVRFSLQLQAAVRRLSHEAGVTLADRIGVHLGEVVIEEREDLPLAKDLYGLQVDTGARVMSLAAAGQTLMTRPVFDNARQILRGQDLAGLGEVRWLSHGRYAVKGLDDPLEICEVGEVGHAPLGAPTTNDKAQRYAAPDEELVLGWRPAVGQAVPNTKWVLEERLGEGGFGEVWKARHEKLAEQRVFKFCFRADRVRSLKREVTLFRLLKERIGEHPHIVKLHDFYFDQPPYYLEEEYVAGRDLRAWCAAQGGVDQVPLEARLELVTQAAEALQAAHDCGVIHRDVKPGNILVAELAARRAQTGASPPATPEPALTPTLSHPMGEGARKAGEGNSRRFMVTEPDRQAEGSSAARTTNPSLPTPLAKLTDFGIGQVIAEESLAGLTRAGFTQTMLSPGSSQTGTHLYMAPELLAGKPASIRSDIYSLGVVLYQLLVGDFTRPVTTDWANEIADPLLRDDLKHCFAGNPSDRFSSAGQLAQNLRGLAQRRAALAQQQAADAERERLSQNAERRRRWLMAVAVATAVLVALAAALGYGMKQAHTERDRQRRVAYAANMNLAQQLLAANPRRAMELLDRHRPKPGEPDLRGWEWRYLWQQLRSDALYTLCQKTNANAICGLSVSGDGKWLAFSENGIARCSIWDLTTTQEIERLPEMQDSPPIAFSPTQPVLAYEVVTNSNPQNFRCNLCLWNVVERRMVRLPGGNPVYGLAWANDGRRLASLYSGVSTNVGEEHNIVVWQIPERSQLAAHPAPQKPATLGTKLVADGGLSVAACLDTNQTTVRVIDLATGNERWNAKTTNAAILELALSADGRTLATTESSNPAIRLWDVASGTALGTLEGHQGPVWAVVFWPDGKRLASGGVDRTIRVWDVEHRRLSLTLRGHRDDVRRLALLPDQRTLVSGCGDGSVCLWDIEKLPADRGPTLLRAQDLLAWRLTRDGRAVITLDRNGHVVQWGGKDFRQTEALLKLGTNHHWRSWRISGRVARPADISRDARWVAVASAHGAVEIWNVPDRTEARQFAFPAMDVVKLQFDAQATSLLVVTLDDTNSLVHIAELNSAREVRVWQRFPAWENYPLSCTLSSDGRSFLALGSGSACSLTWLPSGRQTTNWLDLAVRDASPFAITASSFSPDGALFAVPDSYGIKLCRVANLREIAKLGGFRSGVVSLAFSPDGKRLAVGSRENEGVKLWDVEGNLELLTLEGQEGTCFRNTDFSPEGDVLGSVSSAGVHLWRAPSWTEIEAEERKSGVVSH